MSHLFAVTAGELRAAFNASADPLSASPPRAPQLMQLWKLDDCVYVSWGSAAAVWPAGAKGIAPDLVATNGVFHIVDAVQPVHMKTTIEIKQNGQKGDGQREEGRAEGRGQREGAGRRGSGGGQLPSSGRGGEIQSAGMAAGQGAGVARGIRRGGEQPGIGDPVLSSLFLFSSASFPCLP